MVSDQLADFSVRLAEATGRALLTAPDWRAALDAVADWARSGPLVLVLDEFQLVARENRDNGSIINVWWRERGVDDDGVVTAVGSCQWTSGVLPYSEKVKLDALAKHLVPAGHPPQQYFFARNGFDKRLRRAAQADERVHLVSPDELLDPP